MMTRKKLDHYDYKLKEYLLDCRQGQEGFWDNTKWMQIMLIILVILLLSLFIFIVLLNIINTLNKSRTKHLLRILEIF